MVLISLHLQTKSIAFRPLDVRTSNHQTEIFHVGVKRKAVLLSSKPVMDCIQIFWQ